MFICFVATVYFAAFVSVSVSVVTLYLWGACLQAWPSVQPLSLTKINNNNMVMSKYKESTRRNGLKLFKKRISLTTWLHSFPFRVVNDWNTLPESQGLKKGASCVQKAN